MPRRPPSPRRSPRKRAGTASPRPAFGTRRVVAAVGLAAVSAASLAAWAWTAGGPARLVARAEAASKAGDWAEALVRWRAVNASGSARGRTHLAEARAALALGRASEAEGALRRAVAADPTASEPWRLWLEVLRVEDRMTDAQRVGWDAYAAVPPGDRPAVLRELTLALLADLPDDAARDTLARWSAVEDAEAEPDARAALIQRYNTMPRPGDPSRTTRIEELSKVLAERPGHAGAREALVTALADAGDVEAGRVALDSWPEPSRDARYWRLRGRWDLEYGRDPKSAAAAFARALEELPHDWKTRVRLARALRGLGREAAARREAETVGRLREVLDPAALGPRLAAALPRPDRPETDVKALADLCARAGLNRLSHAWSLQDGTAGGH